MSRNPYHRDDERVPTLSRSVFVFMDILGYSTFLNEAREKGTQAKALQSIHRALTSARRWVSTDLPAPEFADLFKKDPYVLKAFTDNIVIGWPIHDDAEHELGNTLLMLEGFQFQMILEGFFVRGAISIGNAYVDDTVVFGDALLEAYEGESKLARDPRIILTASAVNTVKHHLTYYSSPQRSPQAREILRDADGQWFVNYLEAVLIAEGDQGPFYREFEQHKSVIEELLNRHRANPPIWSKYAWAAGYHNYFCSQYPDLFNAEHKIDMELFRALPSPIVDS